MILKITLYSSGNLISCFVIDRYVLHPDGVHFWHGADNWRWSGDYLISNVEEHAEKA